MKLAKISKGGRIAPAIIKGGQAKVIGAWSSSPEHQALFDVASQSQSQLDAALSQSSEAYALEEVSLLAPIGPFSKIICLGHNYKTHSDETNHTQQENPGLFTKVTDALVGHEQDLINPIASDNFDFEGEIVVVIGKGGRHISRANAMDHVFGYSIMMDGSIRDYQKHSVTAGKNFWHSGSVGPWIVTADDIPDPTAMKMQTRLSGEVMQETSADLMVYDIPFTIEYISKWTPLTPGDIIATGTPGGVGAKRTPPVWMKDGDVIEVEVHPVGVLRNAIQNEVSV